MSRSGERLTAAQVFERAEAALLALATALEDERAVLDTSTNASLRRIDVALQFPDIEIDLRVEQRMSADAWHCRYYDDVSIRIAKLYLERAAPGEGFKTLVKPRTFRTKKGRELGFDVAAMAAHVRAWLRAFRTARDAHAKKVAATGSFGIYVTAIKQKYPGALKRLKMRAAPKGIVITGVLGVADAEAIAKALEERS